MKEAQGTARPGTVMPMREAYVFPAAGVYSIIGGGVGVACKVTVTAAGTVTKDTPCPAGIDEGGDVILQFYLPPFQRNSGCRNEREDRKMHDDSAALA